MGKNRLFQEARHFTEAAEEKFTHSFSQKEKEKAIAVAKNALSSAYPNSTDAERQQLRSYQQIIDRLESQ